MYLYPSRNSLLYSVMTINSWSSKHYGKACWSWKLHYNRKLCPGILYYYCHYCKSWNFKNNPLKENDLKEKLLLHINLFRCPCLPLNFSIFSKTISEEISKFYQWGLLFKIKTLDYFIFAIIHKGFPSL